jgi:hypothetical protein
MSAKRDTIFRSDFLPNTWRGLERFCEDNDCAGLLDGGLEVSAWLFFLLREAKDREEWFPLGKWATIQRLEKLLSEAAAADSICWRRPA